jgi:hypothetical protein
VRPQLSVRARFERFPATVKGALILRGEDPDPHQVVFHGVRAVPVGPGERREVPVGVSVVDVAPHRDLFVPFELMVADLPPGWYGFECDLEVDGVLGTYSGERRFCVPWPRGSVRRGSVPIGRAFVVGGSRRVRVRLDQLDCGADTLRLALALEPFAPLRVRLLADGEALPVLEQEEDAAGELLRLVAYPLLRSHRVLRVEARGRGGAEGALDVRLP